MRGAGIPKSRIHFRHRRTNRGRNAFETARVWRLTSRRLPFVHLGSTCGLLLFYSRFAISSLPTEVAYTFHIEFSPESFPVTTLLQNSLKSARRLVRGCSSKCFYVFYGSTPALISGIYSRFPWILSNDSSLNPRP